MKDTDRVQSTSPDFDDVAPNPTSMLESNRAHGYSLSTAMADLIDNSIAAECRNVWLHFHWAGPQSWVRVTDDGKGMTEKELVNAMRLGSRSPLEKRESSDLGRFGLGLKTASLSLCRRLTVASRMEGGTQAVRRWDLDHLARPGISGWQLLKTAHAGSEAKAAVPEKQDSGTVILLEVLDRLVGNALLDDERMHRHFRESMDAVMPHLAMVFHRYIEGIRPRLRIFLNENKVEPWEPFLEGHPATQSTPEERIRVPGHEEPVRLKGFVLPHKDKLGDDDHRKASGPGGWNAQQGIYVYRNERLIVAGSWLGLGPNRPWTKEEHYKLARIRLDVPSSMDHLWQLNVMKSSTQPPPQLKDRIESLAHNIRLDARAVFAHRGKYGKRADREEHRKPWLSTQTGGARRYRIDRKHPVVEAVLAFGDGSARELTGAMLRILEETVPVEQIWLDAAEKPEEAARPFHGSTAKQRREIIEIAYDAIKRNRRLSHTETIALMLGCEEFCDEESQAIIATLGRSE